MNRLINFTINLILNITIFISFAILIALICIEVYIICNKQIDETYIIVSNEATKTNMEILLNYGLGHELSEMKLFDLEGNHYEHKYFLYLNRLRWLVFIPSSSCKVCLDYTFTTLNHYRISDCISLVVQIEDEQNALQLLNLYNLEPYDIFFTQNEETSLNYHAVFDQPYLFRINKTGNIYNILNFSPENDSFICKLFEIIQQQNKSCTINQL